MTKRWAVRVIVFDLDDTLYPERQFVLSGFSAAGDWLRAEKEIGGLADIAVGLFDRGHRGKIFNLAVKELGLDPEPKLVASLVETYRAHQPALTLHEDAEEILQWSASRFQLGLITDGFAETQRRKVDALALASRISCMVFSDELGPGSWKPSKVPYQEVMARFGGSPAEYVYIGDNPVKDFIGAKTLGWRTIRIRRPGGEYSGLEPKPGYEAEREIADLRELRQLTNAP